MPRTAATSRSAATGIDLDKALLFNGTTSIVTITDDDAYSIGTTNELSVSVWMRPDTTSMPDTEGSGYVEWLGKTANGANEWVFRMYQDGNTEGRANRISFYTFNAAGGLGDGCAFQEEVVPGEWMHLVATVDSGKVMRFYKNGVLKDQFTSTVTFSNTASDIRVGAGGDNSDSNQSFWKGAIDDLRIYNRVLTQDEITRLYVGNSNISRGLVGHWKFDEGSGTTATDSSVTGNDGTITSCTYVSSIDRARTPIKSANRYVSATFDDEFVIGRRLTIRDMGSHSLLFNGTSSIATNAYVTGTSSFSCAFWVRIDRLTVNDRIIDTQASGPADGFTFVLSAVNTISFALRNSTSSVASNATQDIVPLGRWVHVVGTYQVDDSRIYLNGVIQSRDTSCTMSASEATFTLGRRSSSSSNFFKGALDQVLFFERVLSASEIQNLYYAGLLPSDAKIIYNFDNAATDSSGNGLTLTLSNTSYSTDRAMSTRTAVV